MDIIGIIGEKTYNFFVELAILIFIDFKESQKSIFRLYQEIENY
jgi:hypothetical protein